METDFCYNLAMRKASRLMNQLYQKHLSALGLQAGQFAILKAVYHAKVTTNKELKGLLILDQTTLSRNLKPLIRDSALQLDPSTNDQRIKMISLTADGQMLYREALPLWKNAQAEIEKRLGAENTGQILTLSNDLIKAMG